MHFPPWTEEQIREHEEWMAKQRLEWIKEQPPVAWLLPDGTTKLTADNTCPHCGKPL